ncbi:hypothetical protein FRX31_005287 [Thalictrum thalictroides]|uniref:Replication factor A C-terminal domain-containing protein n=1 Tax=Thalictrum thalictroides TaxID=46969 RepID=A0A7J6X8E2_THATH|nr:hypothetical protein FRX31_005287 [Thalictrum thalictroides]
MVVTSLTVKLFDGDYSLSSTNSTKIYVNLDIPEVAQWKETDSSDDNTVKLIAPSSTAITLEERMVTNRKNLAEIVQAVPNAAIGVKFTCKAVVSEVIYDYEPFYFACNNRDCRKKVVPRGNKHWCDNCKNFVDYPLAKYKIHVEIEDHTQSASISIFDKEVERLLKVPVTEMIDINAMDDGFESVKNILNRLVGLEFVFEIKISEFNICNEDGVTSFTASKAWVVNEEIEDRHFTKPIEEPKIQKMDDNDQTKLPGEGNKATYARRKEKEISSSPIDYEDMDDAPSSSGIAKGKRSRRKLISG